MERIVIIVLLGIFRACLGTWSIGEVEHLHLPEDLAFSFKFGFAALQVYKFGLYTASKVDYESEQALNRLDHFTLVSVITICSLNLLIELMIGPDLHHRIIHTRDCLGFLTAFFLVESIFKASLKFASEFSWDSERSAVYEFIKTFRVSFLSYFKSAKQVNVVKRSSKNKKLVTSKINNTQWSKPKRKNSGRIPPVRE